MKLLKQFVILALLLYNTVLLSCKTIMPQGGLFNQSHIGNSISAGIACSVKNYGSGSRGAYSGPYAEVGFGTDGQSTDIGWTEGLGGWTAYGAALSYVKVNDDDSHFERGDYFGVSGKGSIIGLSLCLGIYHEPKLNDNRISFGIGIGT